MNILTTNSAVIVTRSVLNEPTTYVWMKGAELSPADTIERYILVENVFICSRDHRSDDAQMYSVETQRFYMRKEKCP